MRQFAIALLATTMISTAAFAADTTPPQNTQNQMPQNQMQSNQQAQKPDTQNADQSQPISVKTLSRKEIRQVQQALNKNGEKVGPTDGRWGPKTEDALKQFEQAKNIPANGQLDRQAVASLGLNPSEFSQAQAK
jgi:hypothetical protein